MFQLLPLSALQLISQFFRTLHYIVMGSAHQPHLSTLWEKRNEEYGENKGPLHLGVGERNESLPSIGGQIGDWCLKIG